VISFFSEEVELPCFKEQKVLEAFSKIIEYETENDVDYINIIFCSDEYLLNVNREYLNHDYYTDIITFDYSEDVIQSDIYISIDRIAENAISNSVSFENEIYRILLHGVLHLCGYKDKTIEEKKQMTIKEDEYLSVIYE